jgi:hypothetical protein
MDCSLKSTGSPQWLRFHIVRGDGLVWNGDAWTPDKPLLFHKLNEAAQALRGLEEQQESDGFNIGD